jgi:hypothetical protein
MSFHVRMLYNVRRKSSGLWYRVLVWWVDANTTEEPTAWTLKMEAVYPFETVSHNSEGHNMNLQRRENYKFLQ